MAIVKKNFLASSNVRGMNYNSNTKRLTLTFKGGRKYTYSKVPKSTVKGLRSAPSKGRYVNKRIAYNYTYRKHLRTYKSK
jgi:hypothetical protein